MVDAVSSSSSAPPAKLEVEAGSVELDVGTEAGGKAPVEAAPESERGNNVDVEA
jgi:hypothetical protein